MHMSELRNGKPKKASNNHPGWTKWSGKSTLIETSAEGLLDFLIQDPVEQCARMGAAGIIYSRPIQDGLRFSNLHLCRTNGRAGEGMDRGNMYTAKYNTELMSYHQCHCTIVVIGVAS